MTSARRLVVAALDQQPARAVGAAGPLQGEAAAKLLIRGGRRRRGRGRSPPATGPGRPARRSRGPRRSPCRPRSRPPASLRRDRVEPRSPSASPPGRSTAPSGPPTRERRRRHRGEARTGRRSTLATTNRPASTPRIANCSWPSGLTDSTATSFTSAPGGPSRRNCSNAATASGSPSAWTPIEPSSPARTHPITPSSPARATARRGIRRREPAPRRWRGLPPLGLPWPSAEATVGARGLRPGLTARIRHSCDDPR